MTIPQGSTREDLLSRFGAPDLSSLVALRVLASEADERGWLPIDGLVAGVRREYQRLSESPAVAIDGLVPPWEETRSDVLHQYLDEQVVRRLVAEGVLERVPVKIDPDRSSPDSAAGAEVRLMPLLEEERRADRLLLLYRIDERIAEVLSGAAHGTAGHGPIASAAPEGITLAAKGLAKVYRKRRVVNDVDLHVSQGEIVGLLGPNGAGKTTTFYMMVGLIAPDEGDVFIGGQDVTSVPMYRRARKGVGYLSQEPSIFRKLTVEENVLAILQTLGIPRKEQRARLDGLLDELGIKHLRHSKAYALSGGERRRLEITRALVGKPRFMLLDEPFAGVDPIAVHDIQQIVAELRGRDIGVLISDHNVEQTLDIVDRAYIMYDGRVRVSGTVSELVWNDEVAEIYLGPTLTARMRERYSYPT